MASILQTGVNGFQRGMQQMQSAASSIARGPVATTGEGERSGVSVNALTKAAVELEQGQRHAEASARVVATADETLGSLIDTRA